MANTHVYHLPMLNREQANARKLTTLGKIARVQGYTQRSLVTWKSKYKDFPQPVAVLISKPYRSQQLFPAQEVVSWIEDAQFDGRVRYPQGPMPKRH